MRPPTKTPIDAAVQAQIDRFIKTKGVKVIPRGTSGIEVGKSGAKWMGHKGTAQHRINQAKAAKLAKKLARKRQ